MRLTDLRVPLPRPGRITSKHFSMQILVSIKTFARSACWAVFLLASAAAQAWAQSTDIAWPTPVRTNEVVGTIAPRDLGDPRLTDHFYASTGTPGDLLITVDSRNLNGDIDVFTFSGLQPLLKFTVYAGSSSPITKSIYLRKQEDLILRIEGRTPNDDEAVYRIHFGGSFAPITSGPLAEHEDAIQAETSVAASRGGRRVSSVGARIEEPHTEVAETPTPEPTPVGPAEREAKTAVVKSNPRTSRTRRPRPTSSSRRTRPTERKPEETVAKGETENKTPAENPAENSETEPKTPVARKRPTRRGATARARTPTATTPATQEPLDTGPRLIIETSDGTLVDRYMTTVRRVTVENGQVVVVGKDGKIQRIPLASVVRMTIAP